METQKWQRSEWKNAPYMFQINVLLLIMLWKILKSVWL